MEREGRRSTPKTVRVAGDPDSLPSSTKIGSCRKSSCSSDHLAETKVTTRWPLEQDEKTLEGLVPAGTDLGASGKLKDEGADPRGLLTDRSPNAVIDGR